MQLVSGVALEPGVVRFLLAHAARFVPLAAAGLAVLSTADPAPTGADPPAAAAVLAARFDLLELLARHAVAATVLVDAGALDVVGGAGESWPVGVGGGA